MRNNKAKYDITLKIKNDEKYMPVVKYCIEGLLLDCRCTVEEMSDIKAAVHAAVENAIIFAYPGKTGTITIEARFFEDNIVRINVIDKGCGIKDVKKARTSFYTTREEHSGLGFSVMESLCDKVSVKTELRKGTTVTLVKKISKPRYVIS